MLIVDTGVLVAATDRNDRDHQACAALLEGDTGPLITTAMVIADAAYLIAREAGPTAETTLYDSILDGELRVEALTDADWERVRHLVRTYADLPLGGTDAGVIAIAERLGATRIATIDHRHFPVVRPTHIAAFELLP